MSNAELEALVIKQQEQLDELKKCNDGLNNLSNFITNHEGLVACFGLFFMLPSMIFFFAVVWKLVAGY